MWRNARVFYNSGRPLMKTGTISTGRRCFSNGAGYCLDDNQGSAKNKSIDKFFTPGSVTNWSELSGATDMFGRIDRLSLFQLLEKFSTDKNILNLCRESGIDGKIFIYDCMILFMLNK